MKTLDDKVAAVTGAGSGIGRALALELAGRGCRLALSDVDATGLAETERLLTGRARAVTTTVVDVADEAAVLAWADEVVADHGRANLVVNNAGVALSGTVASLSTEDYRWIMGVNFWGWSTAPRRSCPTSRRPARATWSTSPASSASPRSR